MSVHLKLAIPLLDSNITKDDLSKEAGFVDAYNENINRPYLTNHIFLLYEYYSNTEKSIKRDEKLKNSPYLYDEQVISINKKPYLLYTFSVLNKTINNILSDIPTIPNKEKLQIAKCWMFSDEDINSFMFEPTLKRKFKDSSVPEEDWKPDLMDVFDTKKAGYSKQSTQPLFVKTK